jgi:UDP-galactopyranose mutase
VDPAVDLVCFSQLRWDFVYQRPQHLMSRWARDHRVFFVEEPIFDADAAHLELQIREHGLQVVVPHLPKSPEDDINVLQQQLIDRLFADQQIHNAILWYSTPMPIAFTRQLMPLVTVYDCMDELSAFQDAPPQLHQREAQLFQRADLVFTGGHSLYTAKRTQHPHVHLFPSSVDQAHFARARHPGADPDDQARIPRPRLGFYGVLDERLDGDLLAGIADARPSWHLVVIGPVVKINPAILPQRPNIHYLGPKSYSDLPSYLANWDVALMPFAHNQTTRFISPTKTLEYLAAGKPVVSTAIRDVLHPFGEQGLVRIAQTPSEVVAACEAALREDEIARHQHVDEFLRGTSWDHTWAAMRQLIECALAAHQPIGTSCDSSIT